MANTLVQAGSSASVIASGSSGAILGSNVTPGDCVVLAIEASGTPGVVSAVTSPMGAFTPIIYNFGSSTHDLEFWACSSASASSSIVTVTTTGAVPWRAQATEWSGGVSGVGVGALHNQGNGTTASVTLSGFVNGNTVIATANTTGSFSAGVGSPWTNYNASVWSNANGRDVAWTTATSSLSITPSWTLTAASVWSALGIYLEQVGFPTVTSVSPSSGGAGGGASVTLGGTMFTTAVGIKFGSTSATHFTINSSTQITVVSPAGTAGTTVHITVTNTTGTSTTTVNDEFTYVLPATNVQNANASSGSSASVVVHLPANTAAGNTLLAALCLPTGESIQSITDTIASRWIQIGSATSANGNCELWMARGVFNGNASVTAVATGTNIGCNVSEWNSLWYVDPLDQWSQAFGVSSFVTPTSVQPRVSGDLVVTVGCTNVALGSPTGGYTVLPMPNTGQGAAYQFLSGSSAPATAWAVSGIPSWSAIEACFVPGPTGLNPQLQFPEVLVEMSTQNNFLAPIEGAGVWTNISHYVKSMTLGPIGRQHELDRVQSSQASIIVNNRGDTTEYAANGAFNPWNTQSFLYNSGQGLKPMNPVKVTAAWNGVTYSTYYGYVQAVTPQIGDVLNVDVEIACQDILQMLSLQYLANNNLAQAILGNGPVAYYRLGDNAGTYSVKDSTVNGNTGSLIGGPGGTPLFGAAGAILYDPNTALDCTNGTNLPNGGFSTVDNTTQPPTYHNPLGTSSGWILECLVKWTQSSELTGGQVGTLMSFSPSTNITSAIQIGQGISISSFNGATPNLGVTNSAVIFSPGWCGQQWTPSTSYASGTFICPSGAPEYLFYQNVSTGSSGSTQPNWAASVGATTSDGGIQWLCYSNWFAITANTSSAGLLAQLTDGNWHHVVVAYLSGTGAQVIVDGKDAALGALGTLYGANPTNIQFGIQAST